MSSPAPRHVSFLARYVPLVSFVFLCFLGYAAGEQEGALPLDAAPATAAGDLEESTLGQSPADFASATLSSKTDLTTPQKGVERRGSFAASGVATLTREVPAPVALHARSVDDVLAFLASRPTRAGP